MIKNNKKRRKKLSFEVIGDIAILQVKRKYNEIKKIAAQIVKENKHISTVALKVDKVKGRLRKRKLKIIVGKRNFITIHKENKCIMKLNIATCYFSPRLANDRAEIARQIVGRKKVLVMFAGVAPYALVIAKFNPKSRVIAVELSREACMYANENVKLNKLENLEVICGDVKKIIPKLERKGIKFDFIVMPRPQLKDSFLKEAFKVSKRNTTIFFYDFVNEDMLNCIADRIKEEAKKCGRTIRIINIKKSGEIAPYRFRVRVDFKVTS